MIRPWRVLQAEHIADFHFFGVRRDRVAHPDDGSEHDFYLLDIPDIVHVVALTADGHVVLVRQYRHAARLITLEVPAGHVGEGEDPGTAGLRELQEETGYEADSIVQLAAMRPSPARMLNYTHFYLATGLTPGPRSHVDAVELTEVELVRLEDVPGLVGNGTIIDTQTACALYLYSLHVAGRLPSH